MATVKNFGLAGVGSKIQMGKSGGHLDYGNVTSSELSAVDEAGTALDFFNVLTPTDTAHAATKGYVDGVASGLDVKNSVRAATSAAGDSDGFTYEASDDTETAGAAPWSSVSNPVFDGITLADGERVLIKDSATPKGNGIFTFDSGASTFVRGDDADNSPSNEVSGGMFTFVEEGTQAENGYVMTSPNGVATLGTDDLLFVQFSGAGQITAGDGLTKSGNTLDVGGSTTIIANNDTIEVNSSSTAGQILRSGGTPGTAAIFGALDLDNANAVTNTLGVTNGGTNLSTIAEKSVLVSTAADTLVVISVSAASVDQLLLWNTATQDFSFTDSDNIGSAFSTIDADAGDDVVAVGGETLQLRGGTNGGIQTTGTTGTPDAVTIDITGADLTTGAATLALDDFIIVNDSGDAATVVSLKYTFQDVVDDLDIPNGISNLGFVVRSSGDGYTSRTIVASTVGSEEGIIVNDGPGTSGNPEIGLDIDGLTLNTVLSGSDKLVIFDGANNRKINASEFVTDNVLAFTTITPDTGTSPVADSSADTLSILGTASGGITTVGDSGADSITIGLTITDLADGSAETVALDTEIALNLTGDASTVLARKFTFQDVVDDLDIPNGVSTAGFIVRTSGDGSYVSRSITASTVVSEEGIIVNDGGGVAADPAVGLDINGLTLNTVIAGSDELVLFDGTNNRKVTVSELVADVGNSYGQIAGGDGGTTAVSTSSNELITFNGTGINIVTANSTEDADTVTFALDVADLTAGAETLLLADSFAVFDGTATLEYTFQDLVDDLDIPNGVTTPGFIVRASGDGSYVARQITASTVASEEGIIVNDGEGVNLDPAVGLDINGLTLNTVLSGTDELVIFDGTNNVKVLASEFVTDNVLAFTTINIDTGGPITADSSADSFDLVGLANGGICTSTSGANNISFDIVGADLTTGGATLELADFFIVNDSGDAATVTSLKYTFSDLVDDLDIPHGTALNGLGAVTRIATDDGGNDYTVRSIAVSVVAGDEGLSIVDGPGTSGNPTVGLAINDLTLNTVSTGSDFLVIFDGTNNRKITVDTFQSAGDQNLFETFAADGGGPTTAGTPTDTWTFTGGTAITTSITGNVLTITNDEPNIDNPDQNLYETFTGDTGSTTANSLTDSLAITGSVAAGEEGIVTTASTDALAIGLDIDGLTADFVASVALNIEGGGYTAADVLTLIGGTGTFATITVDTIGGSGEVATFTLTTAGDYTVDPTPLISNLVTGGTGSGASFDITMTGVSGTDNLVIFDGTNNRKTSIADLLGNVDPNTIKDGDTKVTAADAADDEGTIDNTIEITVGGDLDFTFDTTKFELLNGAVIHNEEGTTALPSYSFTGDTDSGMYRSAADLVCIAAGGQDVLCIADVANDAEATPATGGETLTISHADGEVRIEATDDTAGTTPLNPVDIRLIPQGTGQVFLGDPGSAASITTSDGANASASGEDLSITAGDAGATSGTGGSIDIGPGAGITGDGRVCIQTEPTSIGAADSTRQDITCFESEGTNAGVNNFVMTNSATAKGPILEVEGTDTNIDMEFLPKGTGVLAIDTDVIAATVYRDNLADDSNDIPNTAYVKELADAAGASANKTLYDTLDDDGLVTGTNTIPLNADITRVVVEVTAVYAGTQGFDIGTAAGAGRVALESDDVVDWQNTGIYIIENHELASLAASLFALGVQNVSAGTGAGTIRVEFTVDV